MMPMHSSSARIGTKDYYLSKLEGNRSDNEIVVLITVKEAGISSLTRGPFYVSRALQQ